MLARKYLCYLMMYGKTDGQVKGTKPTTVELVRGRKKDALGVERVLLMNMVCKAKGG